MTKIYCPDCRYNNESSQGQCNMVIHRNFNEYIHKAGSKDLTDYLSYESNSNGECPHFRNKKKKIKVLTINNLAN